MSDEQPTQWQRVSRPARLDEGEDSVPGNAVPGRQVTDRLRQRHASSRAGADASGAVPTDEVEQAKQALAATNGDRRRAWPRFKRRPAVRARPRRTTYPATGASVGIARRHVVRMARDAGASNDALADIELAVSEASTNAVMHAYVPSGERGETFTIAVASEGAHFSVWVTDEGKGGRRIGPSPGAGLGLEIMARLSERLLIGVLEDGRTQVEMRFDLGLAQGSEAPDAPGPAQSG